MLECQPPPRGEVDRRELREFAARIFEGLPRADQRRAGESYLQGLLCCGGKKSIRRIATFFPNCSEHSLQQFLNGSPWTPEVVRKSIFRLLADSIKPSAWVVDEIAFPKNGSLSAGVERQYARSLGRICNCQVGIVVGMAAGKNCVPVNWRLVIPRSWEGDTVRRSRARIPRTEHPRARWSYQMEALDEMGQEWGMPSAPVVIDARLMRGPERLLAALETRGLHYVIGVDKATVATVMTGTCPECSVPRPGAGDLEAMLDQAERQTVQWTDPGSGWIRYSGYAVLPARPERDCACPPRWLLAEWPQGKPRPTAYWTTDIADRPIAELAELARLDHTAGLRLNRLAREAGLFDYEGRSFPGWHHHVTLASAACAFMALRTSRGADGPNLDPPSRTLEEEFRCGQ